MFVHLRKYVALSLVICFSFSHAQTLKNKLHVQAQTHAHEWVEQYIEPMNDEQKQLIYNMLSLSCQLCIAPIPEILKPLTACTEYITSQHADDKKLQHASEYLQKQIEVLSTSYLTYLGNKAASVHKKHPNIDQAKLEQTKLELAHEFFVSITLAFYNALYTHFNQVGIDNRYMLCMFDEFGLIPEDRRHHTMPEPDLIKKTFRLIIGKDAS